MSEVEGAAVSVFWQDPKRTVNDVAIALPIEELHTEPGWYYVFDEYPDEGSIGPFDSQAAAATHAIESGCSPATSQPTKEAPEEESN